MQRDPLGYVDGMSMYAYYAGMWGALDALGLKCGECDPTGKQTHDLEMNTLRVFERIPMGMKPGQLEEWMSAVDDISSVASVLDGKTDVHGVANSIKDKAVDLVEKGIKKKVKEEAKDKLKSKLKGKLQSLLDLTDTDAKKHIRPIIEKFVKEHMKGRGYEIWSSFRYRECVSCCPNNPQRGEWSKPKRFAVQHVNPDKTTGGLWGGPWGEPTEKQKKQMRRDWIQKGANFVKQYNSIGVVPDDAW